VTTSPSLSLIRKSQLLEWSHPSWPNGQDGPPWPCPDRGCSSQ
jgi:hypothetical protein